MALLEFSLLGSPVVSLNGRHLTSFESDKVRALLYYLAVESEKPVRREQLAGLLWPDYPEKRARRSLSQALYNLRQVIEDRQANPPLLLVEHTTIQMNTKASIDLDTAVFKSLLISDAKSDNIARQLEKAVALYRGDFLAGFSLPDAVPFEEWVLWQREWFHRQTLAMRQRLTQIYEAQGALEEALQHAQQAVAMLPWQEEMQQSVMRLLALNGRRGEALAQYDRCCQILQAELGVEPLPQTQAIYEAIRSGHIGKKEKDIAHLAAKSSALSVADRRHNLPESVGTFVGRTAELTDIHQFIERSDTRLTTIVGPGGIGKTQLALACARQYALREAGVNEPFSDGVFLVNLAPLSEVEALFPALAESVGYQIQGSDSRTPKQQILDYLQTKKMLLVFDNFEHLQSAAILLSEILQQASGVQLLVTSRERLNLQLEQVYPLAGLDFPLNVAEALTSTAVQFFCQCARRSDPMFEIQSDVEWASLVRICRLVAGMPLAIELAASWADTLSLVDIAAEMEQNLDFLTIERADTPDRHHSMRAVFQTSWDRLAEAEQETFAQLSVFRGGFIREAAMMVTNSSLSTLSRLVSKSFLQYDRINNRYQVHELMRQFGAEKLAADPERETAVRHRHSRYFCSFLQERSGDWHTGAQLETLAAINQESDNVENACRFARENRKWSWLVHALDSLMSFYDWNGHLQMARNFCQAISQQMETMKALVVEIPVDGISLWSKSLTWLGKFTQNQEDALECLAKSLKLLELPQLVNEDTRAIEAYALLEQAKWLETFEQAKAKQCYQRSHQLYMALENRWGIARNLEELAVLAYCQSQFDFAVEKAEAALVILEELGDIQAQSSCVNLLGLVHKALGHMDEAEKLHRLSLQLGQQIGYQSTIGIKQAILTDTLLWQGKFEEAKQLAQQSLVNTQAVGHNLYESNAHCVTSAAMLDTGDYQTAAIHADKALEIVTAVGNWITIAYAHMLRGELALVSGNASQAESEFTQGIEYFQAYRPSQTGTLQAMHLYAECRLDHWSQACSQLEEVLDHTLKIRNFLTVVHLLPGAALLFMEAGESWQAVKLWAAATCSPYIDKTQWLYDVIGCQVEEVADTLSAKEAQAARDEGRRLGVWQTAVQLQDDLARIKL